MPFTAALGGNIFTSDAIIRNFITALSKPYVHTLVNSILILGVE
jgi:hypothetical protein